MTESTSRGPVVAIHQPNFFPWLGYFDKMARADVFIWLDDAQFAKSGAGTWCNRVKLLVNDAPAWVTMPVRRDYHGVRRINEMRIDDRQPWREKLLKTIAAQYARAPFYSTIVPLIASLVKNDTDDLAAFNRSAIGQLAAPLGLDANKCVAASSLHVSGRSTDRLVELIRAVGGRTYLSGDGAGGYQEDERFRAAGLDIMYQQFSHPVYRQGDRHEFVAGLSCIDALMHCGFDGTAALLAGRSA